MAIAEPTEIDEGQVYVCAIPFAGPAGDATYGMRLRGTDPRVASNRGAFVVDGTPQTEWPGMWDRTIAINEAAEHAENAARRERFERAAAANRVKLSPPTMFKLRHDVVATRDGAPTTLLAGSILLEGDPLLDEFPDAVKPA